MQMQGMPLTCPDQSLAVCQMFLCYQLLNPIVIEGDKNAQ